MKSNENLKKRVIEIAVIVVMSCILFLACNHNSSGNEILISNNQKDETDATQTSKDVSSEALTEASEELFGDFLYVYVCGEVVSPGLYELPAGSRAMAAVEAAGGFTENAGRNSLNLAQTLTDGSMLRIPTLEEEKKGEGAQISEGVGYPEGSGAGSRGETDTRVNINTADSATLCTIPGIGETKANAILRYREQNGLFASPEDLMNVPGIKSGTFDKIREYVKTD